MVSLIYHFFFLNSRRGYSSVGLRTVPVWATVVCTRAPPGSLAQGRIQLNEKEAEWGGPWFGATSDLIMPRATCADLITLCCAVALVGAATFWSAVFGCNLRNKIVKRTERGQTNEASKKKANRRVHTYIHTGTCCLVRALRNTCYCYIMFERKHNAARHSATPQGKVRHRTARCCAAELYQVAGLSWAG